jgi:hypothetical protein
MCTRAKSTRQSKKKSSTHANEYSDVYERDPYSNMRAVAIARPLEPEIPSISTDLKGPFKIPAGHKGEIYYQAYLETTTRYMRCYTLKAKSDAAANLKDLID